MSGIGPFLIIINKLRREKIRSLQSVEIFNRMSDDFTQAPPEEEKVTKFAKLAPSQVSSVLFHTIDPL